MAAGGGAAAVVRRRAVDPAMVEFTQAMALGVALDLVVIPWGYVFANYERKPGESGTRRHPARPAAAAFGRAARPHAPEDARHSCSLER